MVPARQHWQTVTKAYEAALAQLQQQPGALALGGKRQLQCLLALGTLPWNSW